MNALLDQLDMEAKAARCDRYEAHETSLFNLIQQAVETGEDQYFGMWAPTGHDIFIVVRQESKSM